MTDDHGDGRKRSDGISKYRRGIFIYDVSSFCVRTGTCVWNGVVISTSYDTYSIQDFGPV